jgi:hypothetical protein
MIKILPRVESLIKRSDAEVKNKTQDWTEELQEIGDVLKENYSRLYNVFRYYAAVEGERGQAFCIQENCFKMLVHNCELIHEGATSEDYDTMFIAVNFEADKKSADSIANDDRSIMRFEWLEAVLRMSILRYGDTYTDVSDCVKMFVKNSLDKIDPIEICDMSPNHFRDKRMYNHKVDELLRPNLTVLKAIFEFFRGSGDPKRAKMAKTLDMKDWTNLVQQLDLTEMGLSLVRCILF